MLSSNKNWKQIDKSLVEKANEVHLCFMKEEIKKMKGKEGEKYDKKWRVCEKETLMESRRKKQMKNELKKKSMNIRENKSIKEGEMKEQKKR